MHDLNKALRERAAAGLGRLRFSAIAGRTAVVEAYAASPLKIVLPQNHGSAAWAVTSTYGGGLVGGDTIALEVNVEANAKAVLLSQASTKVYRSALPARQTVKAHVAPGALLVAAPDRVACFAGSTLQQAQQYELDANANLMLLDWISAGRLESGERWAFDHCSSRIEIRREGRLAFLESLLLDAQHGSLALRMRKYNTLATLVFCGPKLFEGAGTLLDAMEQTGPGIGAEAGRGILCGASRFTDDGIVLRWAAEDVETLALRIKAVLKFVADLLGDDPWARRW